MMRSDVALVEVLETPSFVAQPRDLIAIKAKASLERGLRRKGFDVFAEPGDPQRFVLYEIYEDRGALDDRLARRAFPQVSLTRSRTRLKRARAGALPSLRRW